MDKKKAKEFIEELTKLEEKYGLRITSNYEEEIGYDYEGDMCVEGISSYLMIMDEEGRGLSIDDLMDERFSCYYCGRSIESYDDFCNIGCEQKYEKAKERHNK